MRGEGGGSCSWNQGEVVEVERGGKKSIPTEGGGGWKEWVTLPPSASSSVLCGRTGGWWPSYFC